MIKKKDFLFELLTEELPPKSLQKFSLFLEDFIKNELNKLSIQFSNWQNFASPRRIAFIISDLQTKQNDYDILVKGPSSKMLKDNNGQYSKAALSFAHKNNVQVNDIDASGERLLISKKIFGETIENLIPSIIENALNNLPIVKRMRWGNQREQFVRPVKSIILLLGEDIIDCKLLGLKSSNQTQGHKFQSNKIIKINYPREYEIKLQNHFVIADFEKRKKSILNQIEKIENELNLKTLKPESLLDEVCSLTENPQALLCQFNQSFLEVPQEAIIETMQSNQKYFCLVDQNNKLTNQFIVIANIESSKPNLIIEGNQKVITPRLNDTKFFFEKDKETPLIDFQVKLKNIIFQSKLGNLYDKSIRVEKIAIYLAQVLNVDQKSTSQASLLLKADLNSLIVGEFPKMQGIAGKYYAENQKYPNEISNAISEHYQPLNATDDLAQSQIGIICAIADRIDTIVGIFSINLIPTGSKDPYALRRQAIAIIRYFIEKNIHLDIIKLIEFSASLYKNTDHKLINQVFEFIMDRLKNRYEENNINPNLFYAIKNIQIYDLKDFDNRIKAIEKIKDTDNFIAISALNKRITNILIKSNSNFQEIQINIKLFHLDEEKSLFNSIQSLNLKINDYNQNLQQLLTLKTNINQFFEKVLVNDSNIEIKNNRYALLHLVRKKFLKIADLSQI